MLCESEAFFRLDGCPHVANELLSLLVALPDPGGVLKQGGQSHQGVVGPDHASQNPHWETGEVV